MQPRSSVAPLLLLLLATTFVVVRPGWALSLRSAEAEEGDGDGGAR